uniref:Col_cuticle_N domain-containing protein n=1 Tax=Heterorhabditis bacteriophora TaxID=37862 RepID=A0A1I7WPF1_HETBA
MVPLEKHREAKLQAEADRLKYLAIAVQISIFVKIGPKFIGVAMSVIAAFVCILSVPLIYNYVQHVQTLLQNEVEYCKSRSGSLWQQVTKTQRTHGIKERIPRQTYGGYSASYGTYESTPLREYIGLDNTRSSTDMRGQNQCCGFLL